MDDGAGEFAVVPVRADIVHQRAVADANGLAVIDRFHAAARQLRDLPESVGVDPAGICLEDGRRDRVSGKALRRRRVAQQLLLADFLRVDVHHAEGALRERAGLVKDEGVRL